MTARRGWLVVALCVIVGAVASLSPLDHAPPVATVPLTTATHCVNGVVPTECIFGLSGVQYVVQSAYAYEANILPSGRPVGDYDYILGNGVQEHTTLPGGGWNRYWYLGAVCVIGSGWVARFQAPNGGTFDFLHLQDVRFGNVATGPCGSVGIAGAAPPSFTGQQAALDGDEHTAIVAAQLFAQQISATRVAVKGGRAVGLSRWPDWAIYGNGSAGPANAHLCVLLDQKALTWFWTIATGHDIKPKPKAAPFPAKKWGAKPYRNSHGKLVWAASVFVHHQWLGVYRGGAFHKKSNAMTYAFAHGHLYCSIKNHRCVVSRKVVTLHASRR